jgi:hypothetical protein
LKFGIDCSTGDGRWSIAELDHSRFFIAKVGIGHVMEIEASHRAWHWLFTRKAECWSAATYPFILLLFPLNGFDVSCILFPISGAKIS